MSGSRVVVKLGGAAVVGAAETVAGLAAADDVCVVHGAGRRITDEMEGAGVEVRFVGGRRVTTDRGIRIVRAVFAGVRREVCRELGPRALGLCGEEIGLLAVRVPGLGLVGEPLPCAPPAIVAAFAHGRIPVVSPLAVGPLNVNADEAAAALAIGLGAARIVFVSDVPGVYLGGQVVSELAAREATRLLAEGMLVDGIVPKLRAAVTAARSGVRAEIGRTAVLA